jgi:hypothetical protein
VLEFPHQKIQEISEVIAQLFSLENLIENSYLLKKMDDELWIPLSVI